MTGRPISWLPAAVLLVFSHHVTLSAQSPNGNNNDRPVIDGQVVGRDAFRGTPTSEVAIFGEGGIRLADRRLAVRVEVFYLFNHANVVGRNGTYGDGAMPLPTFGQANPGLANLDPGRMTQLQVKFSF